MIIFDELEHAENIINNGYRDKKYVNYDNIILVKYWKYKGCSESQIREMLSKLMSDYHGLFNRDILDYKINRAVIIGMKYDLLTDVTVTVTQGEINSINLLEDIRLRKIMFILLVVWKFRGMPKRFKITNVDLMRLAGERMHGNTFWDCIYKITQTKMLSMVNYKNRAYYVIHIEPDGDEVIRISKFENPVLYYLNLFEPDKYMKCEECGVLVERTVNNRKYCKECARCIQQQQKNEWKKRQEKSRNIM